MRFVIVQRRNSYDDISITTIFFQDSRLNENLASVATVDDDDTTYEWTSEWEGRAEYYSRLNCQKIDLQMLFHELNSHQNRLCALMRKSCFSIVE